MLRPFCTRAGVSARGTSRRLQRVLVDFGAEESFARAALRVREHYGVGVAVGRLRRHTLAHGARMSALEMPPPQTPAAVLLTQMDGSLIPIVTPPAGELENLVQRAGSSSGNGRPLVSGRNNKAINPTRKMALM